MRIHDEKPPESTEQNFWQKMLCHFSSIRVRLTLWYVITTTAVLALFGGLLYSTIVKMLPLASASDLSNVAQQIFVLGLTILLFITAGGYLLAARAMRPVRLITRTAQEIGRTDLSQRVHFTSHDELGELADTFNQMLNRLEAVLNRQRRFTADASHELRTPLSILTLATNRALSQTSEPENYAQALAVIAGYQQECSFIQAETEHMTRLVNDLLLLARADTEQTILTPAEIDMSELALEVVERFAPLAQQRGIELVFGELPEMRVQGDRLLLTLMLSNLLGNALKYTVGFGNQVLVGGSIAREGKQRWARVWIEDNGPGIAEEHQSYLFERFYRVDVARSAPQRVEGNIHAEMTSGSGLGLAIVQWVAQAHQGKIRLNSTPGHGSCFEIRLPLPGASDGAENG